MIDTYTVYPEAKTCNGRAIDFFVRSESLAPAVHDVMVIGNALWSTGASGQH